MLLGVDVGGTFTDAVVFDGAALHTAKAPTTPGDESRGVLTAVTAALERAAAEPAALGRFVHGTTVGTNALLTEGGARTCLIATAGFEDALEIGRQARPSLYRLCEPKPVPLVPTEDRIGAAERVGPEGTIEELTREQLDHLLDAVAARRPDSVAICLLFSYLDPTHERRLAAGLRERFPDLHVSASHEVLPRFREYERCSTTVIDAYLSPLLGRYLEELAAAARERRLPAPEIMRSSGGVAPWEEAARHGAWSVLSGPAGGAVGAGLIADQAAGGDAIGLDVGGTSCDVCVVEGGRVRMTESRTIAGRIVQLPMVDVHTVGAGGGSVAWSDAGGALRVGPRSAGAEPGPACYARGGEEPTVTDANLLLGRLGPDSPLAGGVDLDSERARRAVARLASELGLDELEAAAGIVRLADVEMVRALRVVTVERGVDPRRFALLPFGGAGPMHAAAVAQQLSIDRILCPRAGGVLSALGLLASARRRDTVRTVMLSQEEAAPERIAALVDELRAGLSPGMEDAAVEVRYELRYAGQAFELPIERPGHEPVTIDELADAFGREHERRYGFRDARGAVELVAIGVSLVEHASRPEPRAGTAGADDRGTRPVHFEEGWVDARVVRGEPRADDRFEGPAILELPETTLVLPPGWTARVDPHGTVVARREDAG